MNAELRVAGGVLQYGVSVNGKRVLAPFRLGIEADDVERGSDVILETVRCRKIDEHYRFFGAHAVGLNRANEATISARSHGESYFVDLHVANDGVGVRLRLPAKAGRRVQADRSTWRLEGDPTMWVDKFEAAYESPYHQTLLKQLGTGFFGFPLTAHVGSRYVTLTEVLVKDYGDLAENVNHDGALEGQLYADLREGRQMLRSCSRGASPSSRAIGRIWQTLRWCRISIHPQSLIWPTRTGSSPEGLPRSGWQSAIS